MNGRNKDGTFARNVNRWETDGDVLKCYLGNELLFFTDIANAHLFDGLSVTKIANGYSGVRINGKPTTVHRYLSNPAKHELVDHINGDKKDNRLRNLRNTNKSVNAYNTGLRKSNKTGKTGVYLRGDSKRWAAEIKKDGRKHYLGSFTTIEEAINARRAAEAKYYGFER